MLTVLLQGCWANNHVMACDIFTRVASTLRGRHSVFWVEGAWSCPGHSLSITENNNTLIMMWLHKRLIYFVLTTLGIFSGWNDVIHVSITAQTHTQGMFYLLNRNTAFTQSLRSISKRHFINTCMGRKQAFLFDVCDRTRQHTCKPICACYLSHAWKVIFSWKGLVTLDILLSILRFCLRAPSLNNAVYVNSVSQLLVTTARTPPKTEGQFYRAFLSVFSFFLEQPKLILYTILNVNFVPLV